jgi:hypothetical protein
VWSIDFINGDWYYFLKILDKAFHEAKEVRLSCAPAFFSITVQQALQRPDRNSLESSMAKLMPWTMGQHFGTRLEAQVKYSNLRSCLQKHHFHYFFLLVMLPQIVQRIGKDHRQKSL